MSQRRPGGSPPVGARNSLTTILGIGARFRFKRQAAISAGTDALEANQKVWIVEDANVLEASVFRQNYDNANEYLLLIKSNDCTVPSQWVFKHTQNIYTEKDEALKRIGFALDDGASGRCSEDSSSCSEHGDDQDKLFLVTYYEAFTARRGCAQMHGVFVHANNKESAIASAKQTHSTKCKDAWHVQEGDELNAFECKASKKVHELLLSEQ